MTSLIEIKVPDIGGIADVEIIELLIKPGDTIELEQSLAVMESDKASMDLPAPASGVVQTVHVKVGDKVSEGTLIATLTAAGSVAAAPAAPVATVAEQPKVAAAEPVVATPVAQQAAPVAEQPSAPHAGSTAHASPAIRRYARELGVWICLLRHRG